MKLTKWSCDAAAAVPSERITGGGWGGGNNLNVKKRHAARVITPRVGHCLAALNEHKICVKLDRAAYWHQRLSRYFLSYWDSHHWLLSCTLLDNSTSLHGLMPEHFKSSWKYMKALFSSLTCNRVWGLIMNTTLFYFIFWYFFFSSTFLFVVCRKQNVLNVSGRLQMLVWQDNLNTGDFCGA